MIVPNGVVGNKKVRDAKMKHMYATNPSMTYEDVALSFGITGTRVAQIIYRNKHLLKIDKAFEGFQQARRIKKHIKESPVSKRDAHDWEKLYHDKIKEDAPLVDASQHKHITIVWQIDGQDHVQNSQESRAGMEESLTL